MKNGAIFVILLHYGTRRVVSHFHIGLNGICMVTVFLEITNDHSPGALSQFATQVSAGHNFYSFLW